MLKNYILQQPMCIVFLKKIGSFTFFVRRKRNRRRTYKLIANPQKKNAICISQSAFERRKKFINLHVQGQTATICRTRKSNAYIVNNAEGKEATSKTKITSSRALPPHVHHINAAADEMNAAECATILGNSI